MISFRSRLRCGLHMGFILFMFFHFIERERSDLPSVGSFPKCLQQPRLTQVNIRSIDPSLDLPHICSISAHKHYCQGTTLMHATSCASHGPCSAHACQIPVTRNGKHLLAGPSSSDWLVYFQRAVGIGWLLWKDLQEAPCTWDGGTVPRPPLWVVMGGGTAVSKSPYRVHGWQNDLTNKILSIPWLIFNVHILLGILCTWQKMDL